LPGLFLFWTRHYLPPNNMALAELYEPSAAPYPAVSLSRYCLVRRSSWRVISDLFGPLADVRFAPESDRLLRRREVTLCGIGD
jgi:hypothetical protein